MAASHILVSYAGAVGALPNISRTKEEAKVRAEEARTRVLAGEDFAGVARAYSDDTSASNGGKLGGFNPGVYVPLFEETVRDLPVTGISKVVETPFGFHVIRRDAVTEVHASMLLVSWRGAERAPDGTTRSKEEAKARIDEAQKAIQGGQDWAEVVRKYSDGPLSDQGGDLGWFSHGQLFEPLDSAAFDLDIGKTSAVLDSPRGYYLLKRDE
jgi:peptidyl-prolyl cis-trans isomerase SurA